jgi:hypothetical protein
MGIPCLEFQAYSFLVPYSSKKEKAPSKTRGPYQTQSCQGIMEQGLQSG